MTVKVYPIFEHLQFSTNFVRLNKFRLKVWMQEKRHQQSDPRVTIRETWSVWISQVKPINRNVIITVLIITCP